MLSPHNFKPRKNIPVLLGTIHKKPEYLEMRRMYAQQQSTQVEGKCMLQHILEILRPTTHKKP